MEMNEEELRIEEIFSSYSPYIFFDARLKSFTKAWPHKQENLSPKKMAEAGFYYLPYPHDKGCVKCPFCLKELSSWENEDNPMEEHKRYKERCYFTRLNKKEEEYTVRDVVLLTASVHAAVLEAEAKDTVKGVEKACKQMIDKMKRRVEKEKKEAAHGTAKGASKKTRRKKTNAAL